MSGLTHLDADGAARMVDVSGKAVTVREAVARGRISMSSEAAAIETGMDVLVEVHDAHELERALTLQSRLIGVNNRDLRDFSVDFARTYELVGSAPKDCTFVAESGLTGKADLDAMAEHGIRCFLVGEALMRQPDLEAATRELIGA